MKQPKHIEHLLSCGWTLAQFIDFQGKLYEGYRITVGWHPGKRVWIFGHVPRIGPTFMSLKVGTEALASMMGDPAGIAEQFNARALADHVAHGGDA